MSSISLSIPVFPTVQVHISVLVPFFPDHPVLIDDPDDAVVGEGLDRAVGGRGFEVIPFQGLDICSLHAGEVPRGAAVSVPDGHVLEAKCRIVPEPEEEGMAGPHGHGFTTWMVW